MHIIAKSKLREFWERHRDAEQDLLDWWHEAIHAEWRSPADIKARYVSASIIGDNRVAFNICGNRYRLIVKFKYNIQRGYIRFVGTHKEYDRIDAEEI